MSTFTLRREDAWVLCDAPVPDRVARRGFGALLVATGCLPGGCKFALGASQELRVRAEWPACAESPERLAAIEVGFRAALGTLRGEHAIASTGRDELAPDVARLCDETGWSFEARADGMFATDLEVPGAYVPALVGPVAGGITVEAEIATRPEEDACWGALAQFLLRANGVFRMARAALQHERVVLDVALPPGATGEELAEALSAVAVTARRCAREAQLLATEPDLARLYFETCRSH